MGGRRERAGREPRAALITAFGFGLVHGFGLSFALQPTQQFAGSHPLASLASFNGGVELGLVMALAIAVPALTVVVSRPGAERAATLVLSILLAHAGWHWMTAAPTCCGWPSGPR